MFDPSAPHIIILLIVVILLFGASRLPGAAQAMGRSMHIFRRSVQGLDVDNADSAANPPQGTASSFTPALPPAAPPDATQQQLADLQRQVSDLQRQSAGNSGQQSESQTTRPI